MRQSARAVIGIDEVGRGPIAGPLTVGAFTADPRILRKYFRGVKDSKQLSPAEREAWYTKIVACENTGAVRFSVSFVSVAVLDRIGMSKSLVRAVDASLRKIEADCRRDRVLLDGALRAPSRFIRQSTIIGGDESIPLIALASIVAKVLRDRKMVRLAKSFPLYRFEKHKGYGTREHYRALEKFGLCDLHRRSFLGKFLAQSEKRKV